jgi:hypothetical protein
MLRQKETKLLIVLSCKLWRQKIRRYWHFPRFTWKTLRDPPPQGVREPQVGSTSLKYVTALCCCWQEVCPLFGSPCSVTKHGWQLTSATDTCSYVTRVRNHSCITIGLLPWTRSDRPTCVPARVANYFWENSGTRWPELEGVRYTKITN